MPSAPDPSPYETRKVELSSSGEKVELRFGSNTEWRVCCSAGMAVEKTQRSDEPVSKSRLNFWTPIWTGARYSASWFSGVAATWPLPALPAVLLLLLLVPVLPLGGWVECEPANELGCLCAVPLP